jgi:hypothetical protein
MIAEADDVGASIAVDVGEEAEMLFYAPAAGVVRVRKIMKNRLHRRERAIRLTKGGKNGVLAKADDIGSAVAVDIRCLGGLRKGHLRSLATRAMPRCLALRIVPCCLPQPKMHSSRRLWGWAGVGTWCFLFIAFQIVVTWEGAELGSISLSHQYPSKTCSAEESERTSAIPGVSANAPFQLSLRSGACRTGAGSSRSMMPSKTLIFLPSASFMIAPLRGCVYRKPYPH